MMLECISMRGVVMMVDLTLELSILHYVLFVQINHQKSSGTIQLLKGDTLVARPADTANVMNPLYVNITSTIGYLVTEDILEIDDDVITHS